MDTIVNQISQYLDYCNRSKHLSENTMRAYHIDMKQFIEFLRRKQLEALNADHITREILKLYIEGLLERYAAKTCKRKIACIKAFFHHLEIEDLISISPFRKLRTKIVEDRSLPKTIKKHDIDIQLRYVYQLVEEAKTPYQEFHAARAVACYEILINTGIRIGEICNLECEAIDLDARCIRVFGKGRKERIAYLTADTVIRAIQKYLDIKKKYNLISSYFFVNWHGGHMSEESARRMIRSISSATVHKHITPHMFRHTFASMLLNLNVDIRYIQELMGHSSINTTQIYLHLLNASIRTSLERANLRQQYTCT